MNPKLAPILSLIKNLNQKEQLEALEEIVKLMRQPSVLNIRPRIQLAILPAHNGDTLLIGFEDESKTVRRIWIDGGLVKSYEEHHRGYLEKIQSVGGNIDLMMVTHVDQDHIGGVLAFCRDENFSKDWVRKFWFNSGILLNKHFNTPIDRSREVDLPQGEIDDRSLRQGISLESFLESTGNWHLSPIFKGQNHDVHGAKLQILTPTEEVLETLNDEWQEEVAGSRAVPGRDYDEPLETLAAKREREDRSVPNASSICCLFEYAGVRLLLLGDAHSSDVAASLRDLGFSPENRIQLDAVKMSHHGSKASNTYELLDMLDCQNYLISTDGSRHGLPNKEAMSRVILNPKRDASKPLTFHFNFDNAMLRSVFTQAEMDAHNFTCTFSTIDTGGIELDWVGK